jgi:hypothetical protein
MSSDLEKNSRGPVKSSTMELGAVWSSKKLPPRVGGARLRDDYLHVGDAYNRNQEIADEWEAHDL